ncbi:MAG: FAD-dependent oxidoreductase [Candidatus Sericytochromatia bacterium]|nr:FAD-dependent oxidoreductase [Candidatus Sericytochromatia bacterium]
MGPLEQDFDVLVVGNETEGCLTAVAAARAGARVALLVSPEAMLGGLLTEDGLAFVDRDARHLTPPEQSPHDGIFGQFLARAKVPLVALPADVGAATLQEMLTEAGVTLLRCDWQGVRMDGDRLAALHTTEGELTARAFIDATPDADLAEASGMPFSDGFTDYGLTKRLGISPLPVVHGVSPDTIMATCEALAQDPSLETLRQQVFGDRHFLDLEQGDDYLLIGPPHLGLAYQRWREAEGLQEGPYRFEADGFNTAIVGPQATSWNGLIYFSEDGDELLRLSREGANDFFREEARRFERFLQTRLGWREARVELPRGVYVRQTRHARDVRQRLSLQALATGDAHRRVGTFCYYPDFRGFRAVSVPGALAAHVVLEAGLASRVKNLGLACRAAGYTPFAHSVCRLVQYNVTLGAALGVAAALMPGDDLGAVDSAEIRAELARHGFLADDSSGFERNAAIAEAMTRDPVLMLELAHA